ncbi:hypothetical protein LXL04_016985 [Taraxacum kok-saghyz]
MWMWRRRKQNRSDRLSKPPNLPTKTGSSSKETGSSSSKGQICRRFTIAEIRSATQDFNQSLLIGRGGFGSVYKGTIKDGTLLTVALKRWNFTSNQGVSEFEMEIDLLPMLRHPNIVYLIGFCNDGKELILVYEYMSNGSLKDHLHKHRTPLSWSQRLKICINVASALEYLHNGTSGQEVIYNNVKSANILLDDQWAAKIADFRISTIIPFDNDSTHVSTDVKGTLGYFDPEYAATGRLSKKSDVYSFGVVMLEVLCRRPPFDLNIDGEDRVLVTWSLGCMKRGELEKIIDPELKGQISVKCLNDYARIVKCCLRERQEGRITMAEVVFGLESVLALHERTDNAISKMGITTSDWRLQEHFFSSEQNSEKRFIVISDYIQVLESPKKSTLLTGEASDSSSEPDYEVIARQLSSRDQIMKSLIELMQLEYIQHADGFMRIINFLHLIWFYPVKKEADVNFRSLLDKFSSLTVYIRKSQNPLRDENYLVEIQTLVQDIEEDLDDAAFDMVAYLPQDNRSHSVGFENLKPGANYGKIHLATFWSGIPEVHASATASATNRAISCVKDLKVKMLGIAGSDAEEVADTLKNMPDLRSAFDMVLCVRVKNNSIQQLMNDIEEEIEPGFVHDKFTNCLLFVDCDDTYIDLHDSEFNLSKWFGSVQIVITRGLQNVYCPVDIEIRVEDHLLPWILFSMNIDQATLAKYSIIQKMEKILIEKCNGHLLAIILLARNLRGVVDVRVWELALHELTSQKELSSSSLGVTGDVMVRVIRFIWSRMERLSQRCIMQFASGYIGTIYDKVSLINSWIRVELVKTEEEGENVFEDLIRSFLIERVGGNYIRIRHEIRVIILTHFVPRAYGLYLKEDGLESNRMPTIEEWDAREIHLSNNIISELPDNPNCPILVNLFLPFNRDLMDIPITFFNNMPSLQALDLSSTSIKCLPSSISRLTTLRKLFIKDCDLLMELPPEIGDLNNLKIFDSEGTQLICLPKQFGSLTKLESLKFSLDDFADKHKQSNQSTQIIPATVFPKLVRLKELIICVGPCGEWWEDEVKLIINTLQKVQNLGYLRLYFPTTELLEIFMETKNSRGFPIYQQLSNFGFVVGQLQQRLISRIPHDLLKTFIKLPKCLKYTNGEGDVEVISRLLKHCYAFFVDRHWTVRSLSTFGVEEMEKLKFCLLAECNEMREIVNQNSLDDPSRIPVLGSLEHLMIHYMKSLVCILNGPINSVCLSNLKTLAIHSCPQLRAIFTWGLLDSLTCLEYLIVEDCTIIDSLVSLESHRCSSTPHLPNLKKISLLHLPELVSISRGVSIAPRLESLVVYDCPKLEKLSYMEASDDLWEIKGENEWWDALKWCEPEWTSGRPDYLARVFIPLGTDGDIMDELADAVDLLPHLCD